MHIITLPLILTSILGQGLHLEIYMSGNILVVDDDKAICERLFRTLSANGYTVRVVTDGDACIQQLQGFNWDLVITDIVMPTIDGFELIVRIRQEFPAVKIIAMSGGSDDFNAEQLLSAASQFQVDGYLAKPIAKDDLLALVEEVSGSVKAS